MLAAMQFTLRRLFESVAIASLSLLGISLVMRGPDLDDVARFIGGVLFWSSPVVFGAAFGHLFGHWRKGAGAGVLLWMAVYVAYLYFMQPWIYY